jgi:hypothetical protein
VSYRHWLVTIGFPDGRTRRISLPDDLVQPFKGRPQSPGTDRDVIDQVTVLRMAEAEVWAAP